MTPQEREALIKVRNELNTGVYTPVLAMDEETEQLGLNMNVPTTLCGSVRCIGGWMMKHLNPNASRFQIHDYVNSFDEGRDLHALFFPSGVLDGNWETITPAHAVEAIDNLLQIGNPRWAEVLQNVQCS